MSLDLTDDKSMSVQVINHLLPSHNKPLPEPMLTLFYVAMWHHLASLCIKIQSMENGDIVKYYGWGIISFEILAVVLWNLQTPYSTSVQVAWQISKQ